MARQAKAKEEPAAAGFDALSPDNKEWMKSFEEKGWRFFFEGGEWSALRGDVEEDGGEPALGPFDSFIMLMNTIEREEKKQAGLEPAEMDASGNRFLPGTEPLSVKELDELIKVRCDAVRHFKQWSARIQEINEDCLNAFEKHRDHFLLDEESNKHVYTSPGGGKLRIRHVEKDKVETEMEDPEDED